MEGEDESKKKERTKLYSMYKGPGPAYRLRTSIGTKDHCLTKKQAPAYSMGHKYSEKKAETPGPVYSYDSALTTHGKKHTPAYAISGRPQKKEVEITPGPGDYTAGIKDSVLSKDHKSPALTIGQRTKQLDKGDIPSPNQYNTSVGIGSRSQTIPYSPAWTLLGRSDVGGSHYHGMKSSGPGPASYSAVPPVVYKSAIGGCTIQGRTKIKDYKSIKDNPGPCSYDPYSMNPRKGGFTLGIRHSEYVMPLISEVDIL